MAQRLAVSNGTRAPFSSGVTRAAPRAAKLVCRASSQQQQQQINAGLLQKAAAFAAAGVIALSGPAAFAAAEEGQLLCDASCVSKLESVPAVTTPSGLVYKDIIVGTGPQPIVGYQVVVNYIAMNDKGREFENSLGKAPFDVRVGAGQVIPGLDEGMLSMKVGGVRRLYIPGELAFPKPLKAAAGRPSVPANTPVVFDVQLLYIPGLEADE
ncbi:hypothetical protein OEZ86_003082 [Tetradesmus obliquus]|uniref:peptidylprolyl isomerase n=1 Tax=Tetradesmus obliquus TaxID=3088 RepID=A0A383VZI4_TETOB|nr:hypothetical protein OEZ86_003082 [Tetradesmus obliquus]|eukprot:jgi/Sobl393_1/4837/SZX70289.1